MLVFSVSLSAYFFRFLDNQISADTSETLSSQSGKCPAGKIPVAINNYPGIENLIGKVHFGYYLSKSDMNFRCSHICIEGKLTISTDGDKISGANLSSLEGAKIGENKLIQFASAEDFNIAIQKGEADKENAMKYGIIVSKTRGGKGCQGPNSVDYGKITDKEGNPITMLDRNDTSYEPAAQAEEIVAGKEIVEQSDTTDEDKIAEAPTALTAPTGEGSATKEGTTAKVDKCSYIHLGVVSKPINKDNPAKRDLYYYWTRKDLIGGKKETPEGISLVCGEWEYFGRQAHAYKKNRNGKTYKWINQQKGWQPYTQGTTQTATEKKSTSATTPVKLGGK